MYQKFGETLSEQQEILAALSDVIIEIYLGESAVLRALKARAKGMAASTMLDLATVFVSNSVGRIEHHARIVLSASSAGEGMKGHPCSLRPAFRWVPNKRELGGGAGAVRL